MRTVLVASGKGGTGKTSVTAALAVLAAGSTRVAVADCDVEASNLPLVLRTEVTHREPFAGMPRVVVDADTCLACGACAPACPFGAMSEDADGRATVDGWLCEGCGACEMLCPAGAISFRPEVAGEVLSGTWHGGPAVHGHLRPGADLSGKLVSAVRRRATDLARHHRADLLLVDGPPGVGCPAIAAVTGVDAVLAVTEPTASGEHDLRRLAGLTRRMRTPTAVVLNKSDLSATEATQVRRTCRELGLPVIAEIAYDDALPTTVEAVAAGRAEPALLVSGALSALAGVAGGLAAPVDVGER